MSKKRRVKLGIPGVGLYAGLHMCHIGENAHRRVREAFVNVIHLLCERETGSTHDHAKQLFPVSHALQEIGTFEADVPPKLRELWDAIDGAVSDAQARGEQEGASLLKQLASGKATIHEYNEVAIKSG